MRPHISAEVLISLVKKSNFGKLLRAHVGRDIIMFITDKNLITIVISPYPFMTEYKVDLEVHLSLFRKQEKLEKITCTPGSPGLNTSQDFMNNQQFTPPMAQQPTAPEHHDPAFHPQASPHPGQGYQPQPYPGQQTTYPGQQPYPGQPIYTVPQVYQPQPGGAGMAPTPVHETHHYAPEHQPTTAPGVPYGMGVPNILPTAPPPPVFVAVEEPRTAPEAMPMPSVEEVSRDVAEKIRMFSPGEFPRQAAVGDVSSAIPPHLLMEDFVLDAVDVLTSRFRVYLLVNGNTAWAREMSNVLLGDLIPPSLKVALEVASQSGLDKGSLGTGTGVPNEPKKRRGRKPKEGVGEAPPEDPNPEG